MRDEVWTLFVDVYRRCGGASTMVEWDDHIPSFEETWAEVLKARDLVVQAPSSPELPRRGKGKA